MIIVGAGFIGSPLVDRCDLICHLVAAVTIEALADKIIEMTGPKSEKRGMTCEEASGRSLDEMLIRQPDLSKIKSLIGFEPKFKLEQTFRQVIDFERQRMGVACFW